MSDLSLRPRSAAELIDAAFRMYRQYFVGFVTLSAVTYLPMLVLGIVLGRMVGQMTPEMEPGDLGVLLPLIPAAIVVLAWYAIIEGALSIATSDRYHGREIEPGRAFRDALSRAGTLVGAKMWTGFVLFLTSIFFIFLFIPTLYFFARYFAIPQTMLFERLGIRRGIGRSRQLAKGEKWKVLKTLGLIWLMVIVTTGGISLLLQPDPGTSPSILAQLASSVVSIIVYPLIPITATLLYYDVRIRREGYDIVVMSAGLEGPAPAVAAGQG